MKDFRSLLVVLLGFGLLLAAVVSCGCERRVKVDLWPLESASQRAVSLGAEGVIVANFDTAQGSTINKVTFPPCRRITGVLIQDLTSIPVSVSIFYSDSACGEKP